MLKTRHCPCLRGTAASLCSFSLYVPQTKISVAWGWGQNSRQSAGCIVSNLEAIIGVTHASRAAHQATSPTTTAQVNRQERMDFVQRLDASKLLLAETVIHIWNISYRSADTTPDSYCPLGLVCFLPHLIICLSSCLEHMFRKMQMPSNLCRRCVYCQSKRRSLFTGSIVYCSPGCISTFRSCLDFQKRTKWPY